MQTHFVKTRYSILFGAWHRFLPSGLPCAQQGGRVENSQHFRLKRLRGVAQEDSTPTQEPDGSIRYVNDGPSAIRGESVWRQIVPSHPKHCGPFLHVLTPQLP